MALANYYVDPTSGNDTTGDGTSDGTAWKTVQKALDTITSGATGDQINVKSGTTDVLSSPLSFATYGAPTDVKPMVIRGYTTTANDGGTGEIGGAGSIAIIDDNTLDFVQIIDMRIGNCGSAQILDMDNNCTLTRVEAYGSSNAAPLDFDLDFVAKGCWFHTMSGTNVVTCSNNARITGCHIDGRDGSMSNGVMQMQGNDFFVQGNVIRCDATNARGMEFSATDCTISSNDFYNGAAGTEAAIWSSSGATATGCVLQDNIIEGWSGTGGVPVKLLSSSSEGFLQVAHNYYVNNATNAPSWAGEPPQFSDGNTDLGTTSPFADPDNGDFTVSTAMKEAGFGADSAMPGLSTTNYLDAGAAQREEPAGGGGGGGMRLAGPGGLVSQATI